MVGKDDGDLCAAFELLVDAFNRVAGAHATMMCGRLTESGEA